jgi:hypothetical protein
VNPMMCDGVILKFPLAMVEYLLAVGAAYRRSFFLRSGRLGNVLCSLVLVKDDLRGYTARHRSF